MKATVKIKKMTSLPINDSKYHSRDGYKDKHRLNKLIYSHSDDISIVITFIENQKTLKFISVIVANNCVIHDNLYQ